ncbi:MAG: hypothetical protein EPO25_05520 [Gammaproteobacteria bacterium]|nr:MAG: hypothetical protein EPO25_05520 [Gammaproteobacteria bacterium]
MKNRNLYFGLVACTLVAISGCAKPPDQSVSSVQASVEAAKQAGAETYAAESLNKVQDLLGQAQAEIEAQNGKFALFRNYDKAEEILGQAKTAGDAASQDATAGKEQARQDAVAAIDGAKAKLTAATDAVNTAPMGKDTKAEIEAMKSEVQALATTVTEAETALSAEDYLGAKSQADGVAAKADQIAADVAQAVEKVQSRR